MVGLEDIGEYVNVTPSLNYYYWYLQIIPLIDENTCDNIKDLGIKYNF